MDNKNAASSEAVFLFCKQRGKYMIQIRIHSLDAMRAADHHRAAVIVSGLEQSVVFQQGNHLAGGYAEGFILCASGDI